MFRNGASKTYRSILSRSFHVFSVFLFLAASAAAITHARPCAEAYALSPNDDLEGGLAAGDEGFFRFDLPNPGLFHVEVEMAPESGGEAKLGLASLSCGETASEPMAVLRSTGAVLLVVASPGTYAIRVGAQDPDQAFATYRLRSRFLAVEDFADATPLLVLDPRTPHRATTKVASGGRLGQPVAVAATLEPRGAPPGLWKGGADEDDEAVVEGKAWKGGADEDDEAVVESKDGGKTRKLDVDVAAPGVLRIDTAGLRILAAVRPGSYRLRVRSEEPSLLDGLRLHRLDICPPGAAGTSFLCARSLVSGGARELAASVSAEHELFAFSLAKYRTLRIATAGEVDTTGALYDRHGHRLAVDGDAGGDTNFRLVKTLAPGEYFVRVARRGGEGPVRLSVEELSW